MNAVFQALAIRLEVGQMDLDRIPSEGGFILVSNHPFGPLDALALIQEIRKVRPDFKLGVDDANGDEFLSWKNHWWCCRTRPVKEGVRAFRLAGCVPSCGGGRLFWNLSCGGGQFLSELCKMGV